MEPERGQEPEGHTQSSELVLRPKGELVPVRPSRNIVIFHEYADLLVEVVQYTSDAVAAGVLGNLTYDAAKALLARMWRRGPALEHVWSRDEAETIAHLAVTIRLGDSLSSEPCVELVDADGRWHFEFREHSQHYVIEVKPWMRRRQPTDRYFGLVERRQDTSP